MQRPSARGLRSILLARSASVLEALPYWMAPLRVLGRICVGSRARNCRTGDVLDDEQVQAATKEDVLNALSQMTGKLRGRLGESLATIHEHSVPLAEGTTPSLEAAKAFTTGMNVANSAGHLAAVPLLERAVAIDPGFATAYAWLGRDYGAVGQRLALLRRPPEESLAIP